MYLILASQVDENARALLPLFPKGSVRLLTPRDLSRPGWQVLSTRPSAARGVAGGQRFENAALNGVLTLLPAVSPPELVHIAREDREYVAAEMTAFLKYWLATLPCPVVNPPTSGSLAGPNWRAEQWWQAAREAGLPVMPFSRGTRPVTGETQAPGEQAGILSIGGRGQCGADPELAEMSGRLAERAGLALLSVIFTRRPGRGFVFAGADPIPRLSGEHAVGLLMDYFSRQEVPG